VVLQEAYKRPPLPLKYQHGVAPSDRRKLTPADLIGIDRATYSAIVAAVGDSAVVDVAVLYARGPKEPEEFVVETDDDCGMSSDTKAERWTVWANPQLFAKQYVVHSLLLLLR
jgi:hypothetical protein